MIIAKKSTFILLILFLIKSNLYADFFKEGRNFYIKRQYDKAQIMFLQAAELNDNGNAYYFLGEIEKNRKNFVKSEEYFRLAIEKVKTKKYLKLAYWNLIVFKEQTGKYIEMASLCKELYKRTKDNGAKKKIESLINKFLWTDHQDAKEFYTKGMGLKQKRAIEEAKKYFFKAIQLDPSFLAPKFEIGLQFYIEKEQNSAANYLREIVEKIPFYGEAHLLLGEIYFRCKIYYLSIESFSNAFEFSFLDKKSEYILRLKRGTSFYYVREYAKARLDIEKAQQLNNKAIAPLFMLSAINIKEENYDYALNTLNQAHKLNPKNPEVTYQIGSIYYRMRDSRYISYFDRLFDQSCSNRHKTPNKYYKTFVLLAKNHFLDSKYSRALEVIESLPTNFIDYDLILISAKANFHLKLYNESVELIEKIDLSNEDKFILCIAYVKIGSREKAREILWNLSYYEAYLQKAKGEEALKELAISIEEEKYRILEEERRKEEEERKEREREREREQERKRIESEQNKNNIVEGDSIIKDEPSSKDLI